MQAGIMDEHILSAGFVNDHDNFHAIIGPLVNRDIVTLNEDLGPNRYQGGGSLLQKKPGERTCRA